MRYMTVCSFINILGKIWLPPVISSQTITLSPSDVDSIRVNGKITREGIEQWLTTHTGDFQSIEDFYADIANGERDLIFDWANDDSESMFHSSDSEEGDS